MIKDALKYVALGVPLLLLAVVEGAVSVVGRLWARVRGES